MATPPPINDDTPQDIRVKSLKQAPLKRTFQMQLQGQYLLAFEDACRKRHETPQQLINDVLTKFLVTEGYLPDWWLNGDRRVK